MEEPRVLPKMTLPVRPSPHSGFVLVTLLLTTLLATLGLGSAGGASASARLLGAATRSGTPPEVRGQANAWPLPDHDYSNSRDAGVSPIRSSTVSRMAPAWSV